MSLITVATPILGVGSSPRSPCTFFVRAELIVITVGVIVLTSEPEVEGEEDATGGGAPPSAMTSSHARREVLVKIWKI